jgi:hypothetical protein
LQRVKSRRFQVEEGWEKDGRIVERVEVTMAVQMEVSVRTRKGESGGKKEEKR